MTLFHRSPSSLQSEHTKIADAAIAQVNAAARIVRSRFVTDLPGQEMMYLRKETQARAFASQVPEPTDMSDYPLIAAEVGITGQTAAQVAQIYINLAAQWEAVGAALESVRLGAIVNIEAAADALTIDQILTDFYTAMELFNAPA
ncbi:MAG: hypothetical protein ABJL72_04285 [Roseobacter sp.]